MARLQDFNFLLTDFNRALTLCLAFAGVSLFQKIFIKIITMKNTMALLGMGLAVMLLSSELSAQKAPEVKDSKKSRHIRMTKIENGKTMKLDTVLTGDDVFIWNGDTINPVKHIKKFSPSGFDKLQHIDVNVDRKGGKEKVMIFRHKDRNDGDGNMRHFPPVPPVPPVPHVRMMKMKHAGKTINLNDPNIISYKKKDMSGDREKIEIIRKKSAEPENMNFDFEFEAPEPPEAPVNIREFKGDNQKMKIMEKEIKVDGKKGKEIKVEVETEENK